MKMYLVAALIAILLSSSIFENAFADVGSYELPNRILNYSAHTNTSTKFVRADINGVPMIIINSLPVVINESGYYLLNASANLSTTAIWINSSNVHLNGNGNILKGTNSYNTPAINIGNVKNITIENLHVKNYDYGIVVDNSHNIHLINISYFFTPTGGVSVTSSSDVNIEQNLMKYGNIKIKDSSKILINGSVIDEGIETESSNLTVENSTLKGHIGIDSYTSNIEVYHNTINTTLYGVALYDSSKASIVENSFWGGGIYLEHSFVGNRINNNSINGKHLVYLEGEHNKIVSQPDYAGQVVLVNCNNVTISNQRIDGHHYLDEAIIIINSHNIKVNNNTIFNGSGKGIFLWSSKNVTIMDNMITQMGTYGVELLNSYSIVLTNNTINDNNYGVSLDSSSATIMNNVFAGNNVGIELYHSSENNILDNTFQGGGLQIWESYKNLIENNSVNGRQLIYLEGATGYTIQKPDSVGQVIIQNSQNISIMNQNLSGTNVGIYAYNADNINIQNVSTNDNSDYGIEIYYSTGISLKDSIVVNNTNEGVYLYGTKNIKIMNSIIQNNRVGVDISTDYDAQDRNVHAIIEGNQIDKNGEGIYLWYVDNVTIYDNNLQEDDRGIELYNDREINIYFNSFIHERGEPVECHSTVSNVTLYSSSNFSYRFNNSIFKSPLGNYWDKYSGRDKNGDGIGDTSYSLECGLVDEYPLISLPIEYIVFTRDKGDIDEDGKLTAIDALIYLKYIVGLDIRPFRVDTIYDDLTEDGKITVADALKVLRIAVGIESP